MANKTRKMLGLILATITILLLTGLIGYFVAARAVVANSKYDGKELDYLPEMITRLETNFISATGIHFRGKSAKLYSCESEKKTCQSISPDPERYKEKKPFTETAGVYAKFSLPPDRPKQIVFSRNRGLVGNQTARQYVLLENGKVWFWIHTGNEMGDSFPFWHLNNWLSLVIGVFAGLFAGIIISALFWVGFYPKS